LKAFLVAKTPLPLSYNQCASLETMHKLLGHSSRQMSQHYARLYDSTVKDQFESAASELD
jgi:hypothetical protein